MPRRTSKKATGDWTTGYKIPETIEIDSFVEFCFRLPNDATYQDAFWQHMDKLCFWHGWEHHLKTGAKDYRAKEVAQYWSSQVYLPNRDSFDLGLGCGCNDETEDLANDCTSYPPSDAFIKYLPTNPYDGKNAVSPGYYVNPWTVAKSDSITGLRKGDVYSSIDEFYAGLNPINFIPKMAERLLNGGLPRFEFSFSGKGEVELHLMDLPQGGLYLIRDKEGQIDPILSVGASVDVGDLDSWLEALITLLGLGVTGGIFPEHIIEVDFTKNGKHTLEVMLLPRIDLPDFLGSGYGGGIREIVVCGQHTKIATPPPPIVEIREGEIVYLDRVNNVYIPIPGSAAILESYCACEETDECEEEEDCEGC